MFSLGKLYSLVSFQVSMFIAHKGMFSTVSLWLVEIGYKMGRYCSQTQWSESGSSNFCNFISIFTQNDATRLAISESRDYYNTIFPAPEKKRSLGTLQFAPQNSQMEENSHFPYWSQNCRDN